MTRIEEIFLIDRGEFILLIWRKYVYDYNNSSKVHSHSEIVHNPVVNTFYYTHNLFIIILILLRSVNYCCLVNDCLKQFLTSATEIKFVHIIHLPNKHTTSLNILMLVLAKKHSTTY